MVSYQNPHFYNERYRALVIDDKDPLFRMRVKVRIPDLMITQGEHHEFVGKWAEKGLWAFPANNYLGGRNVQDTKIRMDAPEANYQGSCLIPPRGSHVWVIFEKGDVSHPFYTGSAEYGDCVAPPENQIGKNYQKKWTLLKTNEGRCIIASDDPSDSRFEITGKKRLLDNPPFGNVESVYQIDENQTVFLIDEREEHEKVLLKDYTGNFMKLVQNENGESGTFHMHTNSDMILDCGGNFYLNVKGNIKIRAQNIYVTAVENIFHKAFMQLKEYAQSFDRFSEVYDRTLSGGVDIVSESSINLQAVSKIYQSSISNIRNCATISDLAGGNVSIAGGGSASLIAGGTTIIYGKTGTSIQTDPVFSSLSNSIYYPSYALESPLPTPDGERYQDIEYDKEPILELDTDKDSIIGFDLKHSPVPTGQASDAGVGTMSNESALNQSNQNRDSGNSGDDSGNSSGSGLGSSSGSGSSQNGGSNSNNSTSGSGSGNNGTIVYESTPVTQLTDITSEIQQIASENIYSYYCAGNELTSELLIYNDSLRNYIYARIIGINSTSSSYIDVNGDFIYDLNSFSNVKNKSRIDNVSWFQTCMNSCYENVCKSLVYDVVYDSVKCNKCVEKVYTDIDSIYNYLLSVFIDNLRNALNNDIPQYLTGYISPITSSSYDCFENVMKRRKKKENPIDAIKNSVNNHFYNTLSKALNDCLSEIYVDLQNKVSDILDICQSDVTRDKKLLSTEFVNSVQEKIRNSTEELKERLIEATKIQIKNDSLISRESMDNALKEIKSEADKLSRTFSNIEKYREDSQLINDTIDDFVNKSNLILKNSKMTDEESQNYLKKLSSQFDKKINDALKSVDNFVVADDTFQDTLTKIISKFESMVFLILKVYDNFKNALLLKYSDRADIKTETVILPLIQEISDYSVQHPQNTPEVTTYLKNKIVALYEEIKNQLSVKDLMKSLITQSEIEEFLILLKTNFKSTFSTIDNDSISQQINELINEDILLIEKRRKSLLNSSIAVEDYVNNKFSKYNPIVYETIPQYVGFGYKNLLFLNDKYRKTIAPLIIKNGGNVLSFDIMLNTAEIEEKYPFIDQDAITTYNSIFKDLSRIDTTTKWWENLKSVISQCSILGIRVVINLMNFNDPSNQFIINKSDKVIYTDKNWKEDIQGIFFSKIFQVISQYECDVIYNLGRGSYKNPYDLDNQYYNMYPTCGYLRNMINYFVYNCNVSSNNLCLTSNKNDNLYYYNPYTEYHSYDDQEIHELKEHDILIKDYIDGKENDEADIVTYSTNNIGGYAGYLIKCHKDSIAIFGMDKISKNIPLGADMNDPNVMNSIFCKKSREAVRYFKTNDYFETTGSLEFDLDGEVK